MTRITPFARLMIILVGLCSSLVFLLISLFGSLVSAQESVALRFIETASAAGGCSDTFYGGSDCATIISPCPDGDCDSQSSLDKLWDNLSDQIETEISFTDYIQDIVVYLLGFTALICVLLIIYHGFRVMISGGNEETLKKAKSAIIYAFIGITLIFLAYSITIFVLGDSRGTRGILSPLSGRIISVAHAADPEIDDAVSGTFAEYRIRLSRVLNRIYEEQNTTGVSSATINELRAIMSESIKTLPDAHTTANSVQVTRLNVAIATMQANPKSRDAAAELETLIRSYRDGAKVDVITGDIIASPQSGNAPLTVTLRAENVRDPSGKTLPNANYIWYLKAPRGEKIKIGNGVSINYTFNEEKEYTVFLDVISASKNTYGKTDVLPLQKSIQISALPKIANMILYINGVNASQLEKIKVTPGQARAGLIIDATASRPKEGTRFTRTTWDFGNGRSYSYDGGPRLERQVYAQESDYTVKLRIENNVGGISEKTIMIQVRDPIASIVTPTLRGSITDEFRFTTNSVNSRLNLQHDWLVIDTRENKEIARGKGATFSYKFKKVGEYTVKLDSVGADGSRDSDAVSVVIEPRAPLVSFQADAVSSEQPNVIRLDATQSIDPDTNSADKLQYRWKIDGSERELSKVSRNGAIGEYKMTELGEHTIELTVVSPNGLSATTSKKVQITSLLGANLTVAQKIVRIGEPMLFIADAPEANIFMWDFGDGKGGGSPSTDRRITHVYDRAGVYTVTLTIRSDNSGTSNQIQRVVYVGDADTPVPVITVSQWGETLSPEIGVCGAGQEGYRISRLSSITISGQDSTNIDGTPSNLTYSWKVDQKVSSAQTLPFSFDELKCAKVQLSVRSNQNGATATRSVWMDVQNLPPTLSGLNISSVDTTKDPVVVNVEAVNATDPDGVITSYIWYYWTQTDSEPQEMRVTRTPQTTFVLPGINDKYYFGVILEDSNGAKVKSVDVLSQDASMTLTGDDINTPLISLKASATSVAAGREVTFQASTKDLTDANITDKTNFKWDFDGDGFYDKNGTGSIAKFSYERPGTYRVKVKALYKWVSNTRTINITVTNELKPSFDYIAIGRMIILINSTKWVFNQVTWELPDGATSSELDSVTISLPDGSDSAPITMRVSDGETDAVSTATVRVDTRNLKTAVNQKGTFFVTVPRIVGESISIDHPDERVMLYVGSSGQATRFVIDDNLSVDTNLDWDATNDSDNQNAPSYRNGGVYVIKGFSDRQRERKVSVKLYDAKDTLIDEKSFTITANFVQVLSGETPEQDLSTDIRESDRKNLEELKSLIQSKAPESARPTLLALYSKLKDEWFDQNQKIQTIIDFEKAIAENGLDPALTSEMHALLESFLATDDAMSAEVSVAVSVVRGMIPTDASYAAEVIGGKWNLGLLNEILAAPNNLTENKEKAKRILELVAADENITVENKKILKSQLLIILHGGTENIPTDQIEPSSEGGGGSTGGGFMDSLIMIAKIIAILILAVIGFFLLLFLVFKFTNKNESLGFQDWMIDKLFHHGWDDTPSSPAPAPVAPKPTIPSVPTAAPAVVSDPLATTASSLTSASSTSVSDPLSTTSALPSWMSPPATPSPAASTPLSDPLSSTTSTTAEIPSWLKPVSVADTSAESSAQDTSSEVTLSSSVVSSSEETLTSPATLPSWLQPPAPSGDARSTDAESGTLSQPASESDVSSSAQIPSWLQPTAPSSRMSDSDISESRDTPASDSTAEVSPPPSEIPSWLQNISPSPLISPEGSTRASTPIALTQDSAEGWSADALPSWLTRSESDAPSAVTEVAPMTESLTLPQQDDAPSSGASEGTLWAPAPLPSWLTPAPMETIQPEATLSTSPVAPSEDTSSVEKASSSDAGMAAATPPARKPRRKSRVQEREEEQSAPAVSTPETPATPQPNDDLPAWLRP